MQALSRPGREVHARAEECELGDIAGSECADMDGVGPMRRQDSSGGVVDAVGQDIGDHPQHQDRALVCAADHRRKRLQRLDIRPVGVVDDDDRGAADRVQVRMGRIDGVGLGCRGVCQLFEHRPRMVRLPRCPGSDLCMDITVPTRERPDESTFSDAGWTLDEGEHGRPGARPVEESVELRKLVLTSNQHRIVRHASTVVPVEVPGTSIRVLCCSGRGTNRVTRPPARAITAKM